MTLIDDIHKLFNVPDSENCGIKSCFLLDEECKNELNSAYIKVNQKSITANINVKNGYSQAFCIKCENEFKTVEVKGFTQK